VGDQLVNAEKFPYFPTANHATGWTKIIGFPAFGIYSYLKMRAGTKGTCFPGMRTIADDLGTGTRQVRAAIEVLIEHGLISKRRRPKRRSNIYTILQCPIPPDWEVEDVVGVVPETTPHESEDVLGVVPETTRCSPRDHVTILINKTLSKSDEKQRELFLESTEPEPDPELVQAIKTVLIETLPGPEIAAAAATIAAAGGTPEQIPRKIKALRKRWSDPGFVTSRSLSVNWDSIPIERQRRRPETLAEMIARQDARSAALDRRDLKRFADMSQSQRSDSSPQSERVRIAVTEKEMIGEVAT